FKPQPFLNNLFNPIMSPVQSSSSESGSEYFEEMNPQGHLSNPTLSQEPQSGIERLADLAPFFSFYSRFGLVVCGDCHSFIAKEDLKGHLQKHHFRSSADNKIQITRILTTLDQLPLLDSTFEDIVTQFTAQDPVPIFPELLIYSEAFKCSECSLILLNHINMKRHLSSTHPDITTSSILQITAQTPKAAKRNFFEVQSSPSEGPNRSREEELDVDTATAIAALLAEDEVKTTEIQTKATEIQLNQTREELSPFQHQTQYFKFLQGTDLIHMHDLSHGVYLPSSNTLIHICLLGVKLACYKAYEQIPKISRQHLMVLNSFEQGRTTMKRFKQLQKRETLERYLKFFSQFFQYLLCVFPHLDQLETPEMDFDLIETLKDTQAFVFFTSLIPAEVLTSQGTKLKKMFKLDITQLQSLSELCQILDHHHSDYMEYFALEKRDQQKIFHHLFKTQDTLDGTADLTLQTEFSSEEETQESDNSDSEDPGSGYQQQLLERNQRDTRYERELDLEKSYLRLTKAVNKVMMSCFTQTLDINNFDSPINTFLACNAINKSQRSMEESTILSQKYSAFLYCSQLIVLNDCLWGFEEQRLADPGTENLYGSLSHIMDRFFHNSAQTALAEVLSLRAYAFAVNKTQSTLTHQIIMHDTNTFSLQHLTLSVEDMRRLFRTLLQKTHEILFQDLLLEAHPSEFSGLNLQALAQQEDLANNHDHGFFMTTNPDLQQYSGYLKQRVLKTSILRKQFYAFSDKTLRLKNKAVEDYEIKIRTFLLHLMLAFHLTTGLCSRVTELATVTYCNSFLTRKRTLFFDKATNLLMVKATYLKTLSSHSKEAANIRILCAALSHITALYLALVIPFKQFLLVHGQGRTKLPSPLLFQHKDKAISTKHLSSFMRGYTVATIQQKISVHHYRHLILAFIRHSMHETLFDQDPEISEQDQVAAQQMGHSHRTGQLIYGRSVTNLGNIKVSEQTQFTAFCLRYHRFFHLQDLTLSSLTARDLRIESAVHHSSRLISSRASNTLALRHKHTLSVDASAASSVLNKQVRLGDVQAQLSTEFYPSSEDHLLQLLREFLQDPQAEFRNPEQRLAVEKILQKVNCLTMVTATSSGKTLIYLLCASLSSAQTTVVMVPLVSLKKDLRRRAEEFNISVSFYEEGSKATSLVLASVESVDNPHFFTFLKTLQHEKKLDRIIFDEAHLIVTAANYRYVMHHLKNLRLINTQFIFLTATLPQIIQDQLTSMMFLQNNFLIRGSTSRDTIRYSLQYFKKSSVKDQMEEIQDLLLAYKASPAFTEGQDKILIFVQQINIANKLSDFLECEAYHGQLTAEEKEEALSDFVKEGGEDLLVCTSALSAGFDHPHIRLTIHLYSAWSLVDFVQETGRLSRDEQLADSIILTTRQQMTGEASSQDQALFKQYMGEQVCRRRLLASEMDMVTIEACSSDQELCDLCSQRKTGQDSVREAVKSHDQSGQQIKDQLVKYLYRLKEACAFCLLAKDPGIQEDFESHTSYTCTRFKGEVKSLEYFGEIMSNPRNLQKDSCCFRCLLSPTICQGDHEFKGIILPLIWAVKKYPDRFDTGLPKGTAVHMNSPIYGKHCAQKIRMADADAIIAQRIFFDCCEKIWS
ncbi:MAG: hypothetical protein M4579_007265, partial [Chaenotheca gracillima]